MRTQPPRVLCREYKKQWVTRWVKSQRFFTLSYFYFTQKYKISPSFLHPQVLHFHQIFFGINAFLTNEISKLHPKKFGLNIPSQSRLNVGHAPIQNPSQTMFSLALSVLSNNGIGRIAYFLRGWGSSAGFVAEERVHFTTFVIHLLAYKLN